MNTIVCIDAETQKQWVVREGKDFYSFPRFSEDGKMVLWLEVGVVFMSGPRRRYA